MAENSPKRAEKTLKKVRFGEFTFDLVNSELFLRGAGVRLRPQAARALKLFLSRPGEIVSHQDISAEIWGVSKISRQDSLHQIMRDLRKALSDDADSAAYIETIPRRGYRFRAALNSISIRSLAARRSPSAVARDAVIFGGGLLTVPIAVVLLCVAYGVSG